MSAESPKEAGTTAPITPQKPEGRFSRLLRKLFEVPLESQHTQQPVPRIVQPPPGLEDFADTIQSVIDGRFATERHKEHDIEAAKAAQIAAEAEEKRKAARNQEELERQERDRQYRENQEQIEKGVLVILEPFRVVDRLQYIKDAVWGGKGEIRPIVESSGLELVYSYPSLKLLVQPGHEGHYPREGPSSSSSPSSQKYEPYTSSTSLRIIVTYREVDKVLDTGQVSWVARKELRISSIIDSFPVKKADPIEFFSVRIPREAEESEALLESALKQEAVARVDKGYLPSQLEEAARKELARAKKSGGWMKWVDMDDAGDRAAQQAKWNEQQDSRPSN